MKDLSDSETKKYLFKKEKSGPKTESSRLPAPPHEFRKIQTSKNHLSHLRFKIIKFCLNILF